MLACDFSHVDCAVTLGRVYVLFFNLATIRASVIAALKDADYLHIPEGRRDHTTPAETLRLHGLD
jgi:hypothetical protein